MTLTNSTTKCTPTQGPWSVAVVRLEVFGIPSFHAKCLTCEWKSKGFTEEKFAAKWAKQHGAQHARVAQSKTTISELIAESDALVKKLECGLAELS